MRLAAGGGLALRGWMLVAVLAGAVSCSTPPIEPELPALARVEQSFAVESLWYRQPQETVAPARTVLTPLPLDGRVYHADRPDRIVALELHSGRLLWSRIIAPPWNSPEETVELSGGIGSGAGMLFAGTRQGSVIALDPGDGSVLWQTRLSSEVAAAPVASGGIVITRTHDGRIYALDGDGGARLWVYSSAPPPLTLRGAGRVLIDGERIYAGFSNGKLTALALGDGEVLWETAIGVPEGRSEFERLVDIDADPLIVEGDMYAASYQNRLVSLSALTGRIGWSRDLSIFQNLVLASDTIYATTEQDQVVAIDRSNGNILWQQESLASRGLTAPVMLRGRLVVADRQGQLHWLSPEDGSRTGRHPLGDAAIENPPVVAEGRLIVVNARNGLQVLRTAEERLDLSNASP